MKSRISSASMIVAMAATLGSSAMSQNQADPLARVRSLINSDELIVIWSDGTSESDQRCYQKIYDFDPTRSVSQRLVPSQRQVDDSIRGNKRLAVATGNFIGGSRRHLVAAWAGVNDSIKVIVPSIVGPTLSWSQARRMTLPGPLMPASQSTQSRIHVVAGNFLGDSREEFILGYQGSDNALHLQLYSFNQGDLQPVYRSSLTGPSLLNPSTQNDTWTMTTGDFDGDGFKELVLVWAALSGQQRAFLRVYEFDDAGTFIGRGSVNVALGLGLEFKAQLAAASGDLKNNTVDQIALATAWKSSGILNCNLHTIDVTDSLATVTIRNTRFESFADENTPVGIAAGDLNKDGRDDLVLSAGMKLSLFESNNNLLLQRRYQDYDWVSTADSLDRYTDTFLAVHDMEKDGWPEIVQVKNISTGGGFNQTLDLTVYATNPTLTSLDVRASRQDEWRSRLVPGHYAIALGDFNGDGVRLGDPVHYRKTNVLQPTVILNTPPIHFDVFEPDPTPFDLSGCYPGQACGFSSTYIHTTTTDTTVTTEIHKDWGLDATLSAGGNILGVGVQASLTRSFGEGFAKQTGATQSLRLTSGRTAAGDDWIFATQTDYDFYEYPVYDSLNPQPSGWVLTAVPGPARPLWIESKNDEVMGNVYRPNHEVGNVLSYGTVNSPEVGQLVVSFAEQTIGATGTSFVELEMSTFRQQSADTTRRIGYEVGGRLSGWGIQLEANAQYNSQQISTQTTRIGESILLRGDLAHLAPQFGTSATYHVTPYAYWAKNGALVLDYNVSPLPTNSFWTQRYGGRSDLAFNLPWRLDPEKGLPLPGNDLSYRYRSRDVNFSAVNPNDGDTLTIQARIRNHGLQGVASNVLVRFYLGDPSNGGTPLGQTTVTGGIPARGTSLASLSWTVPASTPQNARIYAVIDPDDSITTEIHENNNIAWAPLRELGSTTSVSGNEHAPETFVLHQSYPNPFNPSTTIRFDLPEQSDVTLTVFNTLGQELATLVKGVHEAGVHHVIFNGAGLASGVYFYRLRSTPHGSPESKIETRKMVLLR